MRSEFSQKRSLDVLEEDNRSFAFCRVVGHAHHSETFLLNEIEIVATIRLFKYPSISYLLFELGLIF